MPTNKNATTRYKVLVLEVNEASRSGEQKQMLVDTGLFRADFKELLTGSKVKLTQIYRNLLLAERYRMKEGFEDSYSIILSPEEHPSTKAEIASVAEYLKPEYAYKLRPVSLENFVDAMIRYFPDSYSQQVVALYHLPCTPTIVRIIRTICPLSIGLFNVVHQCIYGGILRNAC